MNIKCISQVIKTRSLTSRDTKRSKIKKKVPSLTDHNTEMPLNALKPDTWNRFFVAILCRSPETAPTYHWEPHPFLSQTPPTYQLQNKHNLYGRLLLLRRKHLKEITFFSNTLDSPQTYKQCVWGAHLWLRTCVLIFLKHVNTFPDSRRKKQKQKKKQRGRG